MAIAEKAVQADDQSLRGAETVPEQNITLDTLMERAKALVPTLRERAADTAKNRKMLTKTMEDLHTSGLLKYYQPKKYGGYEMDWGAHAYLSAELARGCPSTGWIQSVVGCHTWMAGRMSPQVQDEIFEDPDVLIATAQATKGPAKVEKVDGGFRLSGEWMFSSGVDHSPWGIFGAATENHAIGNFEMCLFAVPKKDFTIKDVWDVAGLQGTGSNNVILDDVFVPEYRTSWLGNITQSDTDGSREHESYIYRVSMPGYFFTVPVGVAVGAAMGAMETYLDMTKTRIGAMFGEKVAEQVPVQTRIAESAAEIASAKLMLDRMLKSLHARGSVGEEIPKSEIVRHKRDTVFIGRQSVNAINRLVSMMGASGLANFNPVNRFFNDARAVHAHHSQQWEVGMAPYGKWALGLETGDKMIDDAPEGDSTILF